MFAKRSPQEEKNKTPASVNKDLGKNKPVEELSENIPTQSFGSAARSTNINQILKGSKLLGDINVTCDLEVSGDVDGNITSLQQSNILIKGLCKGNVETKEGSVSIEGELQGGNITAGKDVKISGKFDGGEVKAGGKIFVDGKFSGKLEGNDIEIGTNFTGKGEIFYRESISIARGAKVDLKISQTKESLKEVKSPPKKDVAEPIPVQQSVK